jgi:hypothetical protein
MDWISRTTALVCAFNSRLPIVRTAAFAKMVTSLTFGYVMLSKVCNSGSVIPT